MPTTGFSPETAASISCLCKLETEATLNFAFLTNNPNLKGFVKSQACMPAFKKRFAQTFTLETEDTGYPIQNLAALRNRAYAFAWQNGFDGLFFVDSDVLVKPDCLTLLLETPAPIASGWYFFRLIYAESAGGASLTASCSRKVHNQSDMPQEPFAALEGLAGGCLLIKREAFNAHLSFDISDLSATEDVNFGKKALKYGFKVMIHPGAFCEHGGLLARVCARTTEKANGLDAVLMILYEGRLFWRTIRRLARPSLDLPADRGIPHSTKHAETSMPIVLQTGGDRFYVLSGYSKVAALGMGDKVECLVYTPCVPMVFTFAELCGLTAAADIL
jgi:hypothetical protein